MPDQTRLLFHKDTPGGLVEVWQSNTERYLTINSIKQTGIHIDQPARLVSPLYHAFLASLLFIETPEKVLLAGLGGGALARYLDHIMPEIYGDAVEINETVANSAKKYFYFPDAGWKINVADIKQWNGSDYDLILLDIADADLTPAWLTSEKMLSQLKQQLSMHGVLVINLLVDNEQSFLTELASIRKVFNGYTLCLGVQDHQNIVVFAFNQRPGYCSKKALKSRTKQLSDVWQLDFDFLLARLLNDNPEGSGVL